MGKATDWCYYDFSTGVVLTLDSYLREAGYAKLGRRELSSGADVCPDHKDAGETPNAFDRAVKAVMAIKETEQAKERLAVALGDMTAGELRELFARVYGELHYSVKEHKE